MAKSSLEASPPSVPRSVFVVAILSTYKRPAELERLFHSLEKTPAGLGAILVVDNADDTSTARICAASSLPIHYYPQTDNLGCGGGLQAGEKRALALFGDRLTHFWILDDDVVVRPNVLEKLLQALDDHSADAAAPMIYNAAGEIGWFSGLLDEQKFRVICRARQASEYLAACGPEPAPFSWSTGICLLFTRRAFEEVGEHRSDFWIRGEDLDFSLRITARFRGVFVPSAEVEHLPPTTQDTPEKRRAEIVKEAAHVQNVSYLGFHTSHGRRIRSKVPGRYYRFLQASQWVPAAWKKALEVFWHGLIRGKPAGATRSI